MKNCYAVPTGLYLPIFCFRTSSIVISAWFLTLYPQLFGSIPTTSRAHISKQEVKIVKTDQELLAIIPYPMYE